MNDLGGAREPSFSRCYYLGSFVENSNTLFRELGILELVIYIDNDLNV